MKRTDDRHRSANDKTPGTVRVLTPIYAQALVRYIALSLTNSYIILYAAEMGVSLAFAGLITSAGMIGTMVFDLPAGSLVRRLGERRAILIGQGMMCVLSLLIGLIRTPVLFGLFLLVNGMVVPLVTIGQLSYMRRVTRRHFRGRALSSVGGLLRIGGFFGPLAGGFLAERWGFPLLFYTRSVLIGISFCIFLFFTVKLETLGEGVSPESEKPGSDKKSQNLLQVFRAHSSPLLRGGISMIFLSLIRSSRIVIMPLWGESLGLDLSEIGLVIGIAGSLEMFMFLPAGRIMDKAGRRIAAVLCLGLFSIGLLLLPAVPRYWWYLATALFIGMANGLGSGINMTVGSDLAPRGNPGPFLAYWRLISDSGAAIAPILIGFVSEMMALTPAILIIGAAGLAGAALMYRLLPETRHRSG